MYPSALGYEQRRDTEDSALPYLTSEASVRQIMFFFSGSSFESFRFGCLFSLTPPIPLFLVPIASLISFFRPPNELSDNFNYILLAVRY